MHAYQDLGRLLLLRQWTSGQPASARLKLRQHGSGYDRRYQVSVTLTI
jgi:hypothetical protein